MGKKAANTKTGKERDVPDSPAGKLSRSKKRSNTPKGSRQQIEVLRARVEELEQTLDAIRKGEVDALIVPGKHGEQVFSLEGTNHPYRVLIEAMNEGAVTIQPDGMILHINRCFAEMTHTPAEQLIGSMFPNLVPPEQRESFSDLLGNAVAGVAAKQELTLQLRGGGLRAVLLSVSPAAINTMPGVILVVTDLTERKAAEDELQRANSNLALKVDERTQELAAANRQMRAELDARQLAEEELRDSEKRLHQANGKLDGRVAELQKASARLSENEERFRMVADNISQLAWTCDHLGDVAWYNRRWLDYTGRTFKEMRGWGWKKVQHPDHVDRIVASVRRSSESGDVWEDTFPLRGKDGQYRWFLSRAFPIRDADGKVRRWFGTNTDITEQRAAEEALRRSHELLTNEAAHLEALVKERTGKLEQTISELEHFSYTITHDMRAPLRSMQGFGGMILDDSDNRLTPQSADYLRRIMNGAQRMDALIRDSLQYAKVIRERLPLDSVRPEPILRGIIESYPSMQPPHVQIRLVDPFPAVIANEAGLAQCFSNLLVNAIKFVKLGVVPAIRIWAEGVATLSRSTEKGGGLSTKFVRFWFEDNGIGISQEYHERIFEMFQQLDKSYEGTGIGLALVRKTAERMGGRAGVESEPGNGSRFWITFKAAAPQETM